MRDDIYFYAGTQVFKNKLDIRDAGALDRAERRFTTERETFGVPAGNFDLKHLQAIHRHLFQDVYDWAGEIRRVEIRKGGHEFTFQQAIETEMGMVHRRLVQADYLRRLPRGEFAHEAAKVLGDVNYIHPFREGNGRTQLQYLKQLGEHAGHRIDLRRIGKAGDWIEASRAAYSNDLGPMEKNIATAITHSHGRKWGLGNGR